MDFPTIVIGGGISGITAAIELAEAGKEVVLIEKAPYLGGKVSGFNNYFPKLCPPACGLEINYRRIRNNPRISFYTGAEITGIRGKEGDFHLNVKLSARLINNLCTSCGLCAEVCPVERLSGSVLQVPEKAAYIPDGLSFPMKYTIDENVCKKNECAKCLEVCSFDAIHLDAAAAEIELHANRIIIATGWQPYDASRLETYLYEEAADVLTNLEFEHWLAANKRENKKFARPSDGKKPESIAFIQCAGSRDENHLSYCSTVCCSASIKHALTLAEMDPALSSEIFYIDLRVTGRNEKLLRKAEESRSITLTKGKVGRIAQGHPGGPLRLVVEDMVAGIKREAGFDMIVLATGLVPEKALPLIVTGEDGFCLPGQIGGIYPVGSAKRPMDVVSSVKDATAASLKAMKV